MDRPVKLKSEIASGIIVMILLFLLLFTLMSSALFDFSKTIRAELELKGMLTLETEQRINKIMQFWLVHNSLLFVLIFVFVISRAWLINAKILKPLLQIYAGAESIAMGRMTHIDIKSDNEIGSLADMINRLVDNLKSAYNVEYVNNRVSDLITAIRNIAVGRYDNHCIISDRDDSFDVLALGLNIMMEDVRKTELERIKLNQELEKRVAERTSELEYANRELESFSYSISHDLRAPLRHIGGFTKLLIEESAGKFSEEMMHYLRVIEDSVVNMEKLIGDLLFFSRMALDQIRVRDVSLNDLIDRAVGFLDKEKRERIHWQIEAFPMVDADPSMMQLVINNLLTNAVKYSIEKEVPVIKIGCQYEPGYIIVFIKDNGVGFDMKYKDKLFNVFQRLHGSDKYDGLGVGLAIVQRIISRHKGRVWAESVVGEGAAFFFTLPYSGNG